MSISAPDGQEDDPIMCALAAAYRRAETAEPSNAMDANVLSAARRHVAHNQARALVHRQKSGRTAKNFWHGLRLPAGAALACAAVAALILGMQRERREQSGVVQPASVQEYQESPASSPLAIPQVLPQAPAVSGIDNDCVIRTNAPVAAERQRLERAGCAASAARLRRAPGGEPAP